MNRGTPYKYIASPAELDDAVRMWQEEGISSLAMDFEEESNLHCYGINTLGKGRLQRHIHSTEIAISISRSP